MKPTFQPGHEFRSCLENTSHIFVVEPDFPEVGDQGIRSGWTKVDLPERMGLIMAQPLAG